MCYHRVTLLIILGIRQTAVKTLGHEQGLIVPTLVVSARRAAKVVLTSLLPGEVKPGRAVCTKCGGDE